MASRQSSNPFCTPMSSLVVSTRLDESRAASVAGSLFGKPNLWQVNPPGCAFAFAAQSATDALSSMLRGAA